MQLTRPRGWVAKRWQGRRAWDHAGIVTLLESLSIRVGAPARRRARGTKTPGRPALWSRPAHEILDTLALARSRYLDAVKSAAQASTLHRPGDGDSDLANLHVVWRRIARIFRRHGYVLDAPRQD